MQVADPAKRFGMRDILLHPWFLTNLPEGSLTMNTWYLRQPDPGPSRVSPSAQKDAQTVWFQLCGLIMVARRGCMVLKGKGNGEQLCFFAVKGPPNIRRVSG